MTGGVDLVNFASDAAFATDEDSRVVGWKSAGEGHVGSSASSSHSKPAPGSWIAPECLMDRNPTTVLRRLTERQSPDGLSGRLVVTGQPL